jgi:hypothetical protein
MTTIQVQTAISPAVLFRMYEQMSHQDMYGGAMYDLSKGKKLQSFESANRVSRGGAIDDTSGYVQIPLSLDQSAKANQVPPLDWYPNQYVPSSDDARKERQKAEYAGFYDQWVRATLSNYK